MTENKELTVEEACERCPHYKFCLLTSDKPHFSKEETLKRKTECNVNKAVIKIVKEGRKLALSFLRNPEETKE